MKVLVTGHEGYIGPVLVCALQADGHTVEGLDAGYFRECVFRPSPEIPALDKDIRDVSVDDLAGFDAVVHLAGLSNDPLGDLDERLTSEINLGGTVRLAQLAKAAGVSRFVFSSSCSVYGHSDDLADEDTPLKPISAYAISKARAEEAIATMADGGFSPTFLRNATVYGVSPRLRLDLVLNNLVAFAYTTGHVRILSDGTPWRPLVHVEDVAGAFAATLRAPRERIHGAVFNVGADGENYRVRELAEIVCDTVPNCQIEYGSHAPADSRDYRVDFSRIRAELPEFRPTWNVRQGASQLYEAFKDANLRANELTTGRRYIRLRQIKHLVEKKRVCDGLRWRSGSGSYVRAAPLAAIRSLAKVNVPVAAQP